MLAMVPSLGRHRGLVPLVGGWVPNMRSMPSAVNGLTMPEGLQWAATGTPPQSKCQMLRCSGNTATA